LQTILQPGLRLISLDTTYGMVQNFWLLLWGVNAYYTDIAGQMAWFNHTLALAQVFFPCVLVSSTHLPIPSLLSYQFYI
jgi:hypothetical protein